MRTNIAAFLLSLLCLTTNAQEHSVGTDIQKKNVLLETFVGTRCKYSGEAPSFVKRIETAHGADKVNAVTVHCGRLSEPRWEGETDYRTQEGDAIAILLSGIGGPFPNGAVNRKNWNYDSQYTFGRYNWSNQSRMAASEDASVNLWANAIYNGATRQMTIRVEGFFTAEQVDAQLRLNVLLTENNFKGEQNTEYGYEYDFIHQHMLRAAVSNVNGDLLENCQGRGYFTKEYVYDVPASINAIPVTPSELELVIFVADKENKHVMNSISVKPTYEAVTLPLKASVEKSKIEVSDGYQFKFLPVVLSNRCDTELTHATFDITLNGVTTEQQWTGHLSAFDEQEISLPIDWSHATNSLNQYQVTLKELNGVGVSADALSGFFNYLPAEVPSEVVLKLYTSPEDPSNYTYTLYDMEGQVVKEFGPYESDQPVEEKLTLQPRKTYCFEIFDRWGNGFTPRESALLLCDVSGNVLQTIDRVKGFGNRVFFTVKSESLPVKTTFGQNLNRALATFSAAYPTTPSDATVEAYLAVQKDERTLTLKQIVPENDILVIPANVGVVLTTPNAAAFQMESVDLHPAVVHEENLLQPSGTNGTEVPSAAHAYILGKQSDEVLFHLLGQNDRQIAANKAYLVVPENKNTLHFNLVFEDEVTGIENQSIVEEHNASIYDLSGRQIVNPVKGGVYIKNGKKYIVK